MIPSFPKQLHCQWLGLKELHLNSKTSAFWLTPCFSTDKAGHLGCRKPLQQIDANQKHLDFAIGIFKGKQHLFCPTYLLKVYMVRS